MSSHERCFFKFLSIRTLFCFAMAMGLCGGTDLAAQQGDDPPPIGAGKQEEKDLADKALIDDTAKSAEAAEKTDEFAFTIGSKAPAIDIEHWISDNEGKFEHVKQLKSGKIYVVEFWATWCPPCIESMPHLSKLQEEFAGKDVQIISVSDEDLETVNEFLDKKVKGKEMTYRELTKNYCLTTDPDGSVNKDYFEASGQSGIPTAFIVGKEGILEWIGHPMEMDEPLAEIVAGTWDRAAFKEKMEAEANSDGVPPEFAEFMATIQKASEIAESGDPEGALELLDEASEKIDSEEIKGMYEQVRVQFVILFVGGEEAAKALTKLADESKDDPTSLGDLLNMLSIVHEQKPLDELVLKTAKEIGEKGCKDHEDSFMMFYGYSKILNLHKESDRAIEAAQKAVDLLDEYEPEEHEEDWVAELSEEITHFLDQLKSEKK